MKQHTTQDDIHRDYLVKLVDKNYPTFEKALSQKDKGAAKIKLHEILETVLKHGINFALESESNAWQRMTELEDAIIAIVSYAPESDLLRARKLVEQVVE